MESRGASGGVFRDTLARRFLKYVRWSSIFALPASIAANVGSVFGTVVGAPYSDERLDVFRFFRGGGGEMSRARLEGISIVVDALSREAGRKCPA